VRRAAIVTARLLLAAALLAAAADLPLPARTDGRTRVHLIDRSASVSVPGSADSLLPRDADDVAERDRRAARSDDLVLRASFGRDVAFDSAAVDPSATNLREALEAALARNPDEIVLWSDGLADPGPALFLCRDRGVPIHAFPLGPRTLRDARIARLEAPAELRSGDSGTLRVAVESTFETPAELRVAGRAVPLALKPGIPELVAVPGLPPGDFRVELAVADDCPGNNRTEGRILLREDQPRLLVLGSSFPPIPGMKTSLATDLRGLDDADLVAVADAALPPAAQERLAAWVRGGGSLLLAGGPRGFARGAWQNTEFGRISPLSPLPDRRVAVVFGVDVSGSMKKPGKLDVIVPFLLDARRLFDADDDVAGMTFSDEARVLPDLAELRRIDAGGGTRIARGIREARLHLEGRQAGRKHIVLLTDGEVSDRETAEERRAAVQELKGIGLTIVVTHRRVDVGENVEIADWGALEKAFGRIFAGIQESERENRDALRFDGFPAVSVTPPPWIHRTTARPDARVCATAGRPPAADPVLAFRADGQGRVAALACDPSLELVPLLGNVAEELLGTARGSLRLSVEPPVVRARGSGPAEIPASSDAGPLVLKQTGPDAWEARLPAGAAGPVAVRAGRARAMALLPANPELGRLGVDRASLERWTKETAGRLLGSTAELDALPRPVRDGRRSGRRDFLVAALVLLFADLAMSTFWKTR
jgi:hypothetical protein